MPDSFADQLTAHQPIPLWPGPAPGSDLYPQGEVPRITAYLLDDGQTHGAVVVCPGGGYAGRAPHEGAPIAQWLNSAGVHAFVCDYRVAPVRHPYPSMDGMRAIRWVRHHAATCRVNPERVGILGFSAGGHMASTVATHYHRGDRVAGDPVDEQSSRPDAAILCYPVVSFVNHPHLGSCENLLGRDATDEQRRFLSNELQVTPETPPMFLWHTADDGGVPVENSLQMATSLSGKGVRFALHVFPHGAHGLGLATEDPIVGRWTLLCGEWLKSLGF